MYIEYDDILTRVSDQPVWWLNGLPRYDPFRPDDVGVYSREVALVQTECQDCRTRYDVAVEPRRYFADLRTLVAYTTALDVGDPPNARHAGISRCTGSTMNSLEIRILEYWRKDDVVRGWKRDPGLECLLVDAEYDNTGGSALQKPVFLRIHDSDLRDEWIEIRRVGDFAAMVRMLRRFGCDRAIEVAHMLDCQRREEAFRVEMAAVRAERFG